MEEDDKNGLKRGLERAGRNHINMRGAGFQQPLNIAEPQVDGEFDPRACLRRVVGRSLTQRRYGDLMVLTAADEERWRA